MSETVRPGTPGRPRDRHTRDVQEAGGTVVTANVDLNHAFGGAKSARSAQEAEEFVTNLLWQMQGFPAQLRQRAHGPAARAVAAYPAALTGDAADAADGTSGADRVDGHGETTGVGDD